MDDKRGAVLMNILWKLYTIGNPLFEQKFEELYIQSAQKRSQLFSTKNKEGDLEFLKKILKDHSIESNEFPPTQMKTFTLQEVK